MELGKAAAEELGTAALAAVLMAEPLPAVRQAEVQLVAVPLVAVVLGAADSLMAEALEAEALPEVGLVDWADWLESVQWQRDQITTVVAFKSRHPLLSVPPVHSCQHDSTVTRNRIVDKAFGCPHSRREAFC